MSTKSLAAAGLLLLALAPLPASAQSSLTAYEAARQALLAVWAELPLTVRNVTLTTDAARSYGNFTPRDGNDYGLGEPVHIYVEVLGYGWRDNSDGTHTVLIDGDLSLLDTAGQTIASKTKFLNSEATSTERLLETYFVLDATLTSFNPGDYTLRYTLHDLASGKEASFDVPITLTGETPASSSEAPASSDVPSP